MLDVLKKIDTATDSFQKNPDVATRDAINAGAVELRDLFIPHLDREDAEVLPMYAKWIPFDEWDRLETKALKGIPKPYMGTAVGAIDEVIRSTPEAQQPAPPPPPVRILLSLSWRKKWAGFVRPLLSPVRTSGLPGDSDLAVLAEEGRAPAGLRHDDELRHRRHGWPSRS